MEVAKAIYKGDGIPSFKKQPRENDNHASISNEKGLCIIYTPIFIVGFQRMYDKGEDIKISGKRGKVRIAQKYPQPFHYPRMVQTFEDYWF